MMSFYARKRSIRKFLLISTYVFLITSSGLCISYVLNINLVIAQLSKLDAYDKENFSAAIYSEFVSDFSKWINFFWSPPKNVIKVRLPIANAEISQQFKLYKRKSAWTPAIVSLDGNISKAKGKVKGASPFHYIQHEKSIKLKTTKNRLFFGTERILEVDKISHPAIVSDLISFDLARVFDVLIPSHRLELFSINSSVPDLRYLVGSIDEQLLRNSKRMPADIYVLKTLGKSLDVSTSMNLVNGFYFHNSWKKESYNNHYDKESSAPIRHLIKLFTAAKSGDQISADKLFDFISIDKFSAFILFNQLIQSTHQDNNHNTGLYFDPWTGKIEPIIVDQMAWHRPFGGTFKQSVPSVDSAALKGVNFLVQNSLNNDLLDYIKSDPRVKNTIYRIWNQKKTKIFNLFSDIIKYEDFLKQNLRPFGPFYLGSRLTNKSQSLKAFHVLEKYIHNIFDLTNEVINNPTYLSIKVYKTNSLSNKLFLKGDLVYNSDQDFSGYDVYVAPGTNILLAPDISITFGNTNFDGRKEKPITVGRLDKRSPFGALLFQNAETVLMSWTFVSGGSGMKTDIKEVTGQVSFHDLKKLDISNSTFVGNSIYDDNVHIVYVKDFTVTNISILDSRSDGLDVDISNGIIRKSKFIDSGNDGVDLMSSTVSIEDSEFSSSGDKGISVGEGSILNLSRSSMSRNNIAIEIKDRSQVALESGNTFLSNGIDLNLKKKNWRFSAGGSLKYQSTQYKGVNITSDKYSVVIDGL
jgi:hypothetical protein